MADYTQRRVAELIEAAVRDPSRARLDNSQNVNVVEYVRDLYIDGLSRSDIVTMLDYIGTVDDARLGATVRRYIERILESAVESEIPDPRTRYELEERDRARDAAIDAKIDEQMERERDDAQPR
jgi:hypothetical protein